MSFLSCIGKKSKKRRSSKNQPLDRLREDSDECKDKQEKNDILDNKDKVSLKSTGSSKDIENVKAENATLKSQIEKLGVENKIYKTECEQHDEVVKTHLDRIHCLEKNTHEMKERMKIAETETARLTIENQRLMTKIVGMEENQAMMSRAELHNMIKQLEEAEQKASSKPATELSGIRTNPAETFNRKKQSQEERQMSWRLSNTEARLSQSEDENKRLREDLKEMLDTHSELQVQLLAISDLTHENTNISEPEYYRQDSNNSGNNSPFLNESEVLVKLKKLEWDHFALKEEYTRLTEECHTLRKRLEDVESAKEELAKDQKRHDDFEQFIERLKKEESVQVELHERYNSLEKTCQNINARVERLDYENNLYKSTNENLTRQSLNQKNELEKIQDEVAALQSNNQKLLEENKKLSQQLQKRKDTIEENSNNLTEDLKKEIGELKRKYEDTCKRLKEANAQTFKQTSQIKSLDIVAPPPSPTTLAEKFRKTLYEDKWSAALSVLTLKFKKDEKKSIQILGELCTESYLFCKRAARVQMDTLLSCLTSPTASHYRSGTFNKRNGHTKPMTDLLPEDLRRRLASYRSRPTQETINKGVNDFLNQIDYDRTRHLRTISERELKEIMAFISACFELCWCMTAQEPPMYLLFKVRHGQDIDSEKFERYKNSGKRADFVLWPAVFTEENGTCLQKGVMLALPERL